MAVEQADEEVDAGTCGVDLATGLFRGGGGGGQLVPQELRIQLNPVVGVDLKSADGIAGPGRSQVAVADGVAGEAFLQEGPADDGAALVKVAVAGQVRAVA